MPWHYVVIRCLDRAARDDAGTVLINRFDAVYRKAGVPSDVEVFHGSCDEKHVFYFSPKASEIAHGLLSEFSSVPCAGQPELSNRFRKIQGI